MHNNDRETFLARVWAQRKAESIAARKRRDEEVIDDNQRELDRIRDEEWDRQYS